MQFKEHVMGINKDQVQGRVDEVKGSMKEATGKVIGNVSLETKGKVEKNLGRTQAKIGDVEENLRKPSK
jgi:uncharacterized protein YjbJ (UPF0337 family)